MRVLMSGLMAATAVAATAVAALGAQAQPGGGDDKLVRIVGCLTGGPSRFVLTNAVIGEDPEKQDTRVIGESGLAARYDLTARDGVALAPHVGHKVELTGTITAPPKAPDPASKGARGRGSAAPAGQFAVTALEMVSPICLE